MIKQDDLHKLLRRSMFTLTDTPKDQHLMMPAKPSVMVPHRDLLRARLAPHLEFLRPNTPIVEK